MILSPKVTLYNQTNLQLNKYFGNKIAERGKRSSREEPERLDVMQRLIIVPKALYLDRWDEENCQTICAKDTPFIASFEAEIPIWINDSKMIEFGLKTGKYLALDTEAVEELVEKTWARL